MSLDLALTSGLNLPPTTFGLAYLAPYRRNLFGLVADAWLEENERDEVTLTEHPIEQGAPINDHAFKRAQEVTLRLAWGLQKSGDLSAETGIYGMLLDWQSSFAVFDLYTGKRVHRNMLMTSIAVTTDKDSEYALMATITCREVIFAKTKTSSATGSSSSSADHADPGATAGSVDRGNQQPSVITDPSTLAQVQSSADADAASRQDQPDH